LWYNRIQFSRTAQTASLLCHQFAALKTPAESLCVADYHSHGRKGGLYLPKGSESLQPWRRKTVRATGPRPAHSPAWQSHDDNSVGSNERHLPSPAPDPPLTQPIIRANKSDCSGRAQRAVIPPVRSSTSRPPFSIVDRRGERKCHPSPPQRPWRGTEPPTRAWWLASARASPRGREEI
jgi:hypothetical protein